MNGRQERYPFVDRVNRTFGAPPPAVIRRQAERRSTVAVRKVSEANPGFRKLVKRKGIR